ncbi:MAG: hypothetical protein ACWA40_05510 [Planktomarina sp.]
MINLNTTAEAMLAAYGGKAFWSSARSITAHVSAHGLAFRLKRRPVFQHARILCDVTKPYVCLTPIGHVHDVMGVLDGDNVRLMDQNGRMKSERQNARNAFPGGRRWFWWDDLDMAYFAGYAFWNYLCLPALLLRQDVHWEELSPGHLRAHFPNHLPTHSPVQDFIVDLETGRLLQHNYTAQVIGGWAKAANVITQHDIQDGIPFIRSRNVTPRGPKGGALPGPTLISIIVHDFSVTNS